MVPLSVKLQAIGNNGNAAEVALGAIKRRGRRDFVRSDSIDLSSNHHPPANEVERHLQGIAVQNDEVYLTTSENDGQLIRARKANNVTNKPRYTFSREPVGPAGHTLHPGGIQAIGSYLAVPVYGNSISEIQFRDLTGVNMPCKNSVPIVEWKPYCVGITDRIDGNGRPYYLMVVGIDDDGTRFAFYSTQGTPGVDLAEHGCVFKHTNVVSVDKVGGGLGYANGVSLITDSGWASSFLGFKRRPRNVIGRRFDGGLLSGDDVDLYSVEEVGGEVQLKFAANYRYKCPVVLALPGYGPSFRWGASATVSSDRVITLYACGRHVEYASSNTEAQYWVQMAVFSPFVD